MEILVSISTRTGQFKSPLFPHGVQHAMLVVQGPESLQDLRDSHCKGYLDPILKWIGSIHLHGTNIPNHLYESLKKNFATNIGDANTNADFIERGESCVEMSAVFSNMPFYHTHQIYGRDALQELTKDLTLPDAWQD
jgi:hypothetical protein